MNKANEQLVSWDVIIIM